MKIVVGHIVAHDSYGMTVYIPIILRAFFDAGRSVVIPIKISDITIGPVVRHSKDFFEIGYQTGKIYVLPKSCIINPACGNKIEKG